MSVNQSYGINIQTAPLSLLIVAAPPIVGSCIVLALASVGLSVWITHSIVILFACGLALSNSLVSKLGQQEIAVNTVVILTLVGLAIPMLGDSAEPERWLPIGPLKLYAAPLLLPSFIAACSVSMGRGSKHELITLAAVLGAALALALQPDASQALGLLVASVVVILQNQPGVYRFGLAVSPLVLITLWAFSLPDPLQPIPHVEEVFALGLAHSLLAGIAIIASAVALVAGLWLRSVAGPRWLSAVAAYYGVLFLCSIVGITPAPLVGYGAGPILGFGLMAGLLGVFGHQDQHIKSVQSQN